MQCPICKHENRRQLEDRVHDLGQCEQCNCGQSELQFHDGGTYFHAHSLTGDVMTDGRIHKPKARAQ